MAGLPDCSGGAQAPLPPLGLFPTSARKPYFMYQGIFDTDFDKYTEDAVALFTKYGLNTVFENLEGFPGGLEDERAGIHQVRS